MSEPQVVQLTHERRSSWRFTLRELLLAFVALCAVLTLAIKSIPFKTTPFFDSFQQRDRQSNAIRAVCKRLQLPYDSAGGNGSFSRNRNSAVSETVLTLRSPHPSNHFRILTELRKEIAAVLEIHGCQLQSQGVTGND